MELGNEANYRQINEEEISIKRCHVCLHISVRELLKRLFLKHNFGNFQLRLPRMVSVVIKQSF